MPDEMHIGREKRGRYEAECGAGRTEVSLVSRGWVETRRKEVCSGCLAIHAVQQQPARSLLAWLQRHVAVLAVRRRIRGRDA